MCFRQGFLTSNRNRFLQSREIKEKAGEIEERGGKERNKGEVWS